MTHELHEPSTSNERRSFGARFRGFLGKIAAGGIMGPRNRREAAEARQGAIATQAAAIRAVEASLSRDPSNTSRDRLAATAESTSRPTLWVVEGTPALRSPRALRSEAPAQTAEEIGPQVGAQPEHGWTGQEPTPHLIESDAGTPATPDSEAMPPWAVQGPQPGVIGADSQHENHQPRQ